MYIPLIYVVKNLRHRLSLDRNFAIFNFNFILFLIFLTIYAHKLFGFLQSDVTHKNIFLKRDRSQIRNIKFIAYKESFVKDACFGKPSKVHPKSVRLPRLLTWIRDAPYTSVNTTEADFNDRARSHIGKRKNPEKTNMFDDVTFGTQRKEDYSVLHALCEQPVNPQMISQKKCLEYLNYLRQLLKRRFTNCTFLDIYQDLYCLDTEYADLLSKEDVFSVFARYDVWIDESLLKPLLKTLKIYKDGKIYYRDIVDLLNWKCDFPTLPKIETNGPYYYSTTYKETIGQPTTNINYNKPAAGIPCERIDLPYPPIPPRGVKVETDHLGDRTSVRTVITPSIFTKLGLSHIDFFKVRDKEEMRSIFENIGIEFPDNSFDIIWEEGLKLDRTGGVCVETFRNLLNLLASETYNHALREK